MMDLSIICTYRCISKCRMCNIWQNPSNPKDELSLETLAKLPKGLGHVNIQGGEPTLRADLMEIIDTVYPKARVTEISSNGLLPDRLVPIIKKYPRVKVRVSLEGDEKTNNRIRGESDGFKTKVEGLKKLKAAGGKDLGFAIVVQDENASQLASVYEAAKSIGADFSASALHNGWQFHKADNCLRDQATAAREIEKTITAFIRSNSIKSWFRAYMILGLRKQIMGHDPSEKCTAGTGFAFIDPWANVFACNVRADLLMGNLRKQSWEDILSSSAVRRCRTQVVQCEKKCWKVVNARVAMRSALIPRFPKFGTIRWVVTNKIRAAIGLDVLFDH